MTIGTMAEKSLHAALKMHYARPGDRLECTLAGSVIDILRPSSDPDVPDECIEIQTRSLGALKPKLAKLLDRCPIRIVHPIPYERTIVRVDADGAILSRRKSPKRGTIYHLFPELVSLPHLLLHPHLTVEAALIREEELLLDDGQGSWRRKHWSIYDRRLVEVVKTIPLTSAADFAALLPASLPPIFDTLMLAETIHQPRRLAQKMVYCLREMGIVEIVGKQGRALLYARSASIR